MKEESGGRKDNQFREIYMWVDLRASAGAENLSPGWMHVFNCGTNCKQQAVEFVSREIAQNNFYSCLNLDLSGLEPIAIFTQIYTCDDSLLKLSQPS